MNSGSTNSLKDASPSPPLQKYYFYLRRRQRHHRRQRRADDAEAPRGPAQARLEVLRGVLETQHVRLPQEGGPGLPIDVGKTCGQQQGGEQEQRGVSGVTVSVSRVSKGAGVTSLKNIGTCKSEKCLQLMSKLVDVCAANALLAHVHVQRKKKWFEIKICELSRQSLVLCYVPGCI